MMIDSVITASQAQVLATVHHRLPVIPLYLSEFNILNKVSTLSSYKSNEGLNQALVKFKILISK